MHFRLTDSLVTHNYCICSTTPCHEQLNLLFQLVKSQEIRDFEFTPALYDAIYKLLQLGWPDTDHEKGSQAWFIVQTLPQMPEFDAEQAVKHISAEFMDDCKQ